MESLTPMGGFQMPFQRRLSRLYNDTKKSSDFVKEPVQNAEDPEIKALHRKLRIQKDRLVSWGIEWSDPTQSAEVLIDSSLSKAGLSEVVGSIMATIKDILAEAEPLWHSSRQLAGGSEKAYESDKSRDQKMPLVTWDKRRFEDLVRDLTTSIDTLYDLSRTRSSYAQSSEAARQRLFKSSSSAEDLRPFESTRMQTPRQIDPATLTNLRSMQPEPMSEGPREGHLREIVFMGKQAYSELTHGSVGRYPYSPLLLEYASFDPIYSTTGIMPPMTRFEKLSAGLQVEPQRSPGSWTGLPHLLGYFEDMEHSRLGLVYRFPATFKPVTFEHLTQNPLYNLCSLSDLLARPDFEPKLEAKFRLAANLANTVFDMHARGITHGNLVDTNVSFCNAVGTDPAVSSMSTGEVDIRRPLVSAFDLFSEPDPQDASSVSTPALLYRHPLDPRVTAQSPLASNADSKTFDLYSLAMLLLSIGLWTKLENLVPNLANPSIPESVLDQLAIRCGTLYMKAVQTCWNAVDQEMTGHLSGDQVVARVQLRASRYLEACCILDGVSNLDERLSDDLGEARPSQPAHTAFSAAGPSSQVGTEKRTSSMPTAETPTKQDRTSDTASSPFQESVEEPSNLRALQVAEVKPKPVVKRRLYPHAGLSPEVVEQWNTVVMPQINMALRAFYRRHPESVEISLESIGECPQKAQPTVLVVCNSVGKVRAILKRRLGVLFDGTTGFGLKVCRGQVLRSRNRGVGRSMAKPGDKDALDDIVAANPGYQERPRSGASIGAWIGDRHLPPVSFGGMILVDDKPYGMTVHHMLDDPDEEEVISTDRFVSRSMAQEDGGVTDLAAWYARQYQLTDSEGDSNEDEEYTCEFSDSESEGFSESAITSEYSEDEELEEDGDDIFSGEPGDIPGIAPSHEVSCMVTQPALDDVEEGFYPSPETQDEDHLNTYSLGHVYASSGIRRRAEDGLIHEVDWALFEFHGERLPTGNSIPQADVKSGSRNLRGRKQRRSSSPVKEEVVPKQVAPTASLPGLEVQCMARTSGLQTGTILPILGSVKIYGRQSPSHTYQISGTPEGNGRKRERSLPPTLPMGVPGDSGAWIVERGQGRVCGHILAWSERKRVAYFCPMDVLLRDIAETLRAREIRLPGGEVVVTRDEVENGSCGTRSSWVQGIVGGGAGEDPLDEGVEADIAQRMGMLEFSGQRLSPETLPVR
ncbi:hypothetical protein VTK73DRAFT_918 [Phialemonium thermophilum]|uniref:Protein kinase domain-containing protein n=1 Tax=Phialemonium thermophilum TaxID=223376 RepID=A0ABR3XCE1_9PEZI